MAVQNLNIAEILVTIGDYLKSNKNIKDFCVENFEKQVSVQLGEVLDTEEPTTDDCPYIVIFAGNKEEGTSLATCTYSMVIAAGISTKPFSKVETAAGSIIHIGYDLINNFLTLIQQELNKRRLANNVTVNVIGSMNADGSHWAGTMELSYQIDQVLGMSKMQEV